MGDPELSISTRCVVDAFVGGDEREDPQFTRFIQLDSMLCILEEWPENRGQIEILKHRYPETYSKLEEFVRRLDSESTDRLRDSMLKDYRRLAKYFDGYYFQRYPERRQEGTRQVWDSDQEGTFRRAEKKVGRNDPCPCGSGKKYKNCCGRKG
ncbi:MAG: SEC-C domain-containing protein [Lachnospiraceae bacterium]|nr:SEC-C domain-containing protein [Lachnospiraceae bacterium]